MKRLNRTMISQSFAAVKPKEISEKVKAKGTWLAGKKINTTIFIEQIAAIDITQHQGMGKAALKNAHSH